jgi:hypothetical protein
LKELPRLVKSAIGIVEMMTATYYGWGVIVAIAIQLFLGKMYLFINGIMRLKRIIPFMVHIKSSTVFSVMGKKDLFEERSAVIAVMRMNLNHLKIQTISLQNFHSSVGSVI